jgi:hypothetical protein
MRSEKFNIGAIREMDQIIRDVMNAAQAKYSLQMNASLYLPRNRGGRGLRMLEATYKKTRIKAALNLIIHSDPRMRCVKMFDDKRKKNNRSSIIKDAERYLKDDFGMDLEINGNEFLVHFGSEESPESTAEISKVSTILKSRDAKNTKNEITSSTWQGVILKSRYDDSSLILEKCFTWLTKWKDCPVDIVNDFQSIYLQIVPTKTFQKYRGHPNISTLCRLCNGGTESVKHLLSNCTKFVAHQYKRRHDRVLQYILYQYMAKKINSLKHVHLGIPR